MLELLSIIDKRLSKEDREFMVTRGGTEYSQSPDLKWFRCRFLKYIKLVKCLLLIGKYRGDSQGTTICYFYPIDRYYKKLF
jgi:hypothetical protein